MAIGESELPEGRRARAREVIKVQFHGLPGVQFSYADSGWNDVDRHLELAYAITVHKSQGSQVPRRLFFLVLPRVAG